VMGADATAAYCAEHAEVGAILVALGEREGEIQVSTFGLDSSRWRRGEP
jgi:hypothetical protein